MAWTPTQECAMDLGNRDLLISAVAGAGKTATLTERIIRSLTAPPGDPRRADISRMLIVTFTRAAAAELRVRISEALLEKIASCQDEAMRAHLNDQLLKLSSAHISTIDSFYQDVVRTNFERLDLPAGFRLVEDGELMPLKEQLLYRIIEDGYRAAAQAAPNPDAPLDALEGNAFALAMDNLIANRDRGDLPQLLLKLYNQLLTYPRGLAFLTESADRLQRESTLPVLQSREGVILTEIFLPALRDVATALEQAVEGLAVSLKAEKNVPLFAHDLAAVQSLIAALQSGDWDASRAIVLSYAPAGRLKNVPKDDAPADYAAYKKARDVAKDLLTEKLPAYFEFDAAECALRMKRTAQTQLALYSILDAFDKEILKEKKRRAAFEFTDIRTFMLRLLQDENGNPTDIATSLCRKFDAVYIDEYQDVDAVQDRIFSLIGEGGKRFMVGDIKQSIYGFRGSEPSLFTAYKNTFPLVSSTSDPNLSPNGNHISMAHNFRCDRPIIDFTNDVCSYLFEVCPRALSFDPATDNLLLGKAENERIDVPVQLALLTDPTGAQKAAPEDTLQAEALYVASEIDRLIRTEHLPPRKGESEPRRIQPRDVAILIRAEKGAEQLVKALDLYHISTDFAPRVNLASHPYMTMMVNLLSVIDNPHDDIPLMGLFSDERSPVTLGDILTVRSRASATSLYEDLRKAVLQPDECALSEKTRTALCAFFRLLDEWRALAATLPADKLLRNLYAHPSLAPLAASPALLSIYDHARTFQSASFCGLYQFLQYFRRILDNPVSLSTAGLGEQENAVKIMTIHGSKGLQFPVVFLYNCAKQFNNMDENNAIVFDRELGAATRLYSPQTASMDSSLTRAVIRRRIRENAREEEMRILYVALTRARERLYISAKIGKTALEDAELPTRGRRYHVLSASNSAAWILSALSQANLGASPQKDVVNVQTLDVADILAHANTLPATAAEQPTATPPKQDSASAGAPPQVDTAFYQGILTAHQSYVDPRAAVRRLPTKAAASKLRSSMLDEIWLADEFGADSNGQKSHDETPNESTAAYVKNRIELMRRADRPFDALVRESASASASERGTANHLFLQHCDFARLAAHGVDAELATLTEQGYLPRRAAAIISRERLEAFLHSDLFSLVSKPGVELFRELHFDRFVPYAHLTKNEDLIRSLADYTLYVQGSLDLLVKDTDGTLWLCDYKTDHIRAEGEEGIRNQMLDDHADQLRIYAKAVEGLFGRRPDHVLIYSLPLGRSIELTDYL